MQYTLPFTSFTVDPKNCSGRAIWARRWLESACSVPLRPRMGSVSSFCAWALRCGDGSCRRGRVLSYFQPYACRRSRDRFVWRPAVRIAFRRLVEGRSSADYFDSDLPAGDSAAGERQRCLCNLSGLGEGVFFPPGLSRDYDGRGSGIFLCLRVCTAPLALPRACEGRCAMKESIAPEGLRHKITMAAAIFGLFFGLMPPYVLTIVVVATWGVPPMERLDEQSFRTVYFLRLILGNVLGLTVGAFLAAAATSLGLRMAGKATYL